jgi:hypothetical protein
MVCGRACGSGTRTVSAGFTAATFVSGAAAGTACSSSSSSSVEKPNSLARMLPFFGLAAEATRDSSPIAPALRAAASDVADGPEEPRFSRSASASA